MQKLRLDNFCCAVAKRGEMKKWQIQNNDLRFPLHLTANVKL